MYIGRTTFHEGILRKNIQNVRQEPRLRTRIVSISKYVNTYIEKNSSMVIFSWKKQSNQNA